MLSGGKPEIQDKKHLEDMDAIRELRVFNCMGLGAKAMFNDEQLTPLSGQLASLKT